MSVFDESIHKTTPECQFDLLVDGELSEADRRALLVQLEHETGGWRRCALAFLEAQCWKAELGQIVPSAAQELVRTEPISQAEPTGRRQSWRQYAATMLTVAASFLIALVVVRGWSGGSSHSPDSSLLKTAVDKFPLANSGASPAASPEVHAVPATPAADNWEMVTLSAAKSPNGQTENFCVPALRRDTLDQNMLEHVPDIIPPELQQAFEQSGHRVVQQREIVPVQMKDGRRLVVPVDHIEIHYVGRPSL